MGKRGPASAAQLAVIGPSGIETVRRSAPPSELSDEEAIEWREIVNGLPAGWVGRETFPLLIQYCRSVIRARRVAQIIEAQTESGDVNGFRCMLRTEAELSRTIAALATKMRISQQSTYDHRKSKPVPLPAPWRSRKSG